MKTRSKEQELREKALKSIKSSYDIRRKRAVEDILETQGRNLGASMRKAGYAENYARIPQIFMRTNKTKAMLDWINYEVEKCADRMDKTRSKAKYKELSDSLVNLKKLGQLLGGQATERIVISPEEKEEVDRAFNING